MENQTIFFGFCKNKNEFQGTTILKDYSINNSHKLKFLKNNEFISVSIAGFSSNYIYYLNTNNVKQLKLNNYFINKYVNCCENKEELLKYFI